LISEPPNAIELIELDTKPAAKTMMLWRTGDIAGGRRPAAGSKRQVPFSHCPLPAARCPLDHSQSHPSDGVVASLFEHQMRPLARRQHVLLQVHEIDRLP